MVKIMENPIKMDDLGGFTIIVGNTRIVGPNIYQFWQILQWQMGRMTPSHRQFVLVEKVGVNRQWEAKCLEMAPVTNGLPEVVVL